MNLKEIICEPGFKVESEEEINYKGFTFKYIRALKIAEDLEYSVIGEYFLLDLTEKSASLLFSNETITEFIDFQNEMFINRFFRYKNDIRWNLYLILVVENKDILNKIPIEKIENDDNYARKFIFSGEDAKNFFDRNNFIKGQYLSEGDNNLPTNPIADWTSILNKANLTGVFDSFQKYKIKQYIEKNEPLNPERLDLLNEGEPNLLRESNNFVCTHIKEINIGNFRDHCFNKEKALLPTKVNLVHGSNGSGKTSILECIEYAITNEIKHCKEFKDNYYNQFSSVKLVDNGNKELELQSGKDKNTCKMLDNLWYGTPYAKGNTTCTLNSNFNHFNNFNSETIYSFALEEASKDSNYNYLDKLSKLFYNDEIILFQKNWIRYKEAFQDELISLSKKDFDFNNKLNSIESELKTTDISIDNIRKFSREFLDKLNMKISYKDPYTTISLIEEYEKIDQIIKSITPNIKQLKENINTHNIYNINDINEQKNKIDSYLKVLKSNYKIKLEEKVKKEKDMSNIMLSNEKIKLDIDTYKKNLQYLNETIEKWNQNKLILKSSHVLNEIDEIKKNIEHLSRNLHLIESAKIKYSSIISMNENDISQENEAVINSDKTKLSKYMSELSEIDSIIANIKNNTSKLKQLKINLYNLSSEILKCIDDKNKCPLCGSIYQTSEDLINNIKYTINLFSDEEISLSNLEKKSSELRNEISILKIKIQAYDTHENNINLLKTAALIFDEQNLFSYSTTENISNTLKQIQAILSNTNNIYKSIQEYKELLNIHIKNGFSDNAMQQAYIFKENNGIYKKYNSIVDYNKTFEEYIRELSKDINKKIEELECEINSNNNFIITIKDQIVKLGLDELKELIINIEDDGKVLNSTIDNYNTISHFIDINPNYNIRDWINLFEKLIIDFKVQLNSLNLAQNTKAKQEELINLRLSKKQNATFLERCQKAVNLLEELKDLSVYSKSFIEKNIERIEYFFKLLHTPREFKSLYIESDGITATRAKDNSKVKMHQMSTGQRTSFAISVIITMYVASKNSPRFILLDEPVANLDDLNLLNLLDILRELAINGTQIIFTTANPEVAGIFRRKFSFWGQEFKHFELSRHNENTNIYVKQYRPDVEISKILVDN